MKLAKLLGTKRNRRTIATVFVVGLLVGSAGVVAGLSMTTLDVQQISLFGSQTADSDFNIQKYDTKIGKKGEVNVNTELKNTGTDAHEANVTVQLLDASGDVIAEETKSTGSVAGGGTKSVDYKFTGDGLAKAYEETFIVIDQSS